MLARKTNPIDIDLIIDQLQVSIDAKLSLMNIDYDIFPRAYKNPKKFDSKGFIPEFELNGEYKECLFNDALSFSSFFVVGDKRDVNEGMVKADLSLIVQCKGSEMFPLTTHRADEEVINMFSNIFNNYGDGLILNSVETGVNNVYKEFAKENLNFDDIGDYLVVRINGTATFENSCCTNC
jgi:hypothetical protein